MDIKRQNRFNGKNTDNNYLLEEWKQVNDYINKIEIDHTAKFAIFLSGIIVSLATLAGVNICDRNEVVSYIFAIIPIAAIGMLAYTIFQFKNNEIARAYLKYLEETILKKTGYKCIRNKELYKFFKYGHIATPIIIFLALFALEYFCIAASRRFLFSWWSSLRLTYWIIIICTVIILFIYFWVSKEKLNNYLSQYFDEKIIKHYDDINPDDFYKWKKSRDKSKDKCNCLTLITLIVGVAINAGAILFTIFILR